MDTNAIPSGIRRSEELGIDLDRPASVPTLVSAAGRRGFAETRRAAVLPPEATGGRREPRRSAVKGETREVGAAETRDRLDAILDQIDRIPDLPEPFDPLDWDEHGLPR